MAYVIHGLDPMPYAHLRGLGDAALAAAGARRCIADAQPGYPDRVSLTDVATGTPLLLVNHEHVPGPGPYRACHAVFIAEDAVAPAVVVDALPPMLRARLVSLRAFDAGHQMRDADVAEGDAVAPLLERLLRDPQVAYVNVHTAKRGCFLAKVQRR